MSVRAKFKVNKVEISSTMRRSGKDEKGVDVYSRVEMRTIHMSPVYGNGDPNHENTKFWDASPSGSLMLGTINPEAWQQFELDAEYYLDFTKAP